MLFTKIWFLIWSGWWKCPADWTRSCALLHTIFLRKNLYNSIVVLMAACAAVYRSCLTGPKSEERAASCLPEERWPLRWSCTLYGGGCGCDDLITKIFSTRCLLVLPNVSSMRWIYDQLLLINNHYSPLQVFRTLSLSLPGHLLGFEVHQADRRTSQLFSVVDHLHDRPFHIGMDLRKARWWDQKYLTQWT